VEIRMTDDFKGDDAHLVSCIESLIALDADGALVPHGLGGHARGLLSAAAARLYALQTVKPQAGEAVAFDAFLCRAWGETDMPAVELVTDWEGVRRFMIREWLGEEDEEQLLQLKDDFDAHEEKMGRNGGPFAIEFEIGSVSVERVCGFGFTTPAQAAIDAREKVSMASKMEVESWRRSLLVWREASHAELIENTAGLKQCLSNAARLLLDHPSLASRDAAPAPAAAEGVLADSLWNNEKVMSLNAELGLSMDQLERLAHALAQPAPVQQEAAQLPRGFLSDVMTAAGLIEHGRRSKAMAERLSAAVSQIHDASIATRRAALTPPAVAAPAVPDGWRLVPVDPTEAMVDAFHCEEGDGAFNKWEAMLAAAPSAAPAQAGETGEPS
jgi:hypothetical protein